MMAQEELLPVSECRLPAVARWQWGVLIGILLVATGLRVHGLVLNSFWIDELYAVEFSTGSRQADIRLPRGVVLENPPRLAQMSNGGSAIGVWFSLKEDCHPPLHYLLLHWWREIFGSSEESCRLMSVVASVAGIGLLFDLGRTLFGPGVGLWACGIMAVAQTQIWYAQEARGYALLTALVIGAATAVARMEKLGFNRRRGMGLFMCVLGAMLTHYYAAAACVAVGIYALVRLRGSARWKFVWIIAGAALVWGVVWGPFFLEQMRAMGAHQAGIADTASGFLARWEERLWSAPMRLFAIPLNASMGAARWIWLILILPLALVKRRPAYLLLVLWGALCIALPAVMDLWENTLQLRHERYFLAAAPALYLISASLLAEQRRRWLIHFVPGAFMLYCVLSLPWVYVMHKPDWRGLGAIAEKNVSNGDAIVFASGLQGHWYTGAMYLAIDYYAPQLKPRVLLLDEPASEQARAALERSRQVWLATDGDVDAKKMLPDYKEKATYFAWEVGFLYDLNRSAIEKNSSEGGL